MRRGLYRGLTLNYIKTVPNVAIYMSLYDLVKNWRAPADPPPLLRCWPPRRPAALTAPPAEQVASALGAWVAGCSHRRPPEAPPSQPACVRGLGGSRGGWGIKENVSMGRLRAAPGPARPPSAPAAPIYTARPPAHWAVGSISRPFPPAGTPAMQTRSMQ